MFDPKEIFFEGEMPIDFVGNSSAVPGDLKDVNKLRQILMDMKDFGKKTY